MVEGNERLASTNCETVAAGVEPAALGPVLRASAVVEKAVLLLRQGETSSAEMQLSQLLAQHPNEPDALHVLGMIRSRQRKFDEAASLLVRSLEVNPKQPQVQFNLGFVLREQGNLDFAIAAFRAAITLNSDFAGAYLALGDALYSAGKLGEAEQNYHEVLRLSPKHALAKLCLGSVLIDTGRTVEAEAILQQAVLETDDKLLIGKLEQFRGFALASQFRLPEAIACYERAQIADPSLTQIDQSRAWILADLGRLDEATDLFRKVLEREPLNPTVHIDYNNLLYGMGLDDEFLRSYDEVVLRAPENVKLPLDKAAFLLNSKRFEEAHETYSRVLARDPENLNAKAGLANALTQLGQLEPALNVFQSILSRYPDYGVKRQEFYGQFASVLAMMHEPHKAAAMAQRGLEINAHNQFCLAVLETSYRMMGDARGDWLNDYSKYVRIFDLEPPEGYNDIAAFNADLGAYLNHLHPLKRGFTNISVQGGTQTRSNLLDAGHKLVEQLRARVSETIHRYVAEIGANERHPFLARRSNKISYNSAWSSRLHDCGFHVNHVHFNSWISSCYYIAVPGEVSDPVAKQGWIKFGEPPYDVGLADPVARFIQPVPGRLILFPSYTWHGTIPFHSATTRATIAFDVNPA